MKLLRKAIYIFDRIIDIAAFFASGLIIFSMIIVCFEVLMRYFLNRPTIWVVEIAEYCILFITFLATAWVLKRESHVQVDLVLNALNPRSQTLLNIITSIIGAMICLIIMWYGIRVTGQYFEIGLPAPTELRTPRCIITAIIPIGSFLLFVQFVIRTHRHLEKWRGVLIKE